MAGSSEVAFAGVVEEFERNFTERGEIGASLCVMVEGKPVVDIWGGVADAETGRPWLQDTVGVVFSCTKAAVALGIQLLIDSGEITEGTPVASVWPEFAVHGKDTITVGMMLNHSAGIPVLSEPIMPSALEDWDYFVGRIASQAPLWEPGTQHGYHAVTFGHVLGEVIRRVTGSTPGEFFAARIAGPENIDFWIGLPEQVEQRVAPILLQVPSEATETPFLDAAFHQRGSIPNLFLFNSGNWTRSGVNTRAGLAAEIPAANGVTNGRGLARLYRAIARHPVLGDQRRGPAHDPSISEGFDRTLFMQTRFSKGFMLAMDKSAGLGLGHSLRIGPHAFGHCGSGGSIGFTDPDRGLSVGYTMNKLGPGPLLNNRGQALVDAIYGCLGDRIPANGPEELLSQRGQETR